MNILIIIMYRDIGGALLADAHHVVLHVNQETLKNQENRGNQGSQGSQGNQENKGNKEEEEEGISKEGTDITVQEFIVHEE